MENKVVVDLYELPQEVVAKFWKNFENEARKITDLQEKHKFVDTVLDEPDALDRLKWAFVWDKSPERGDYWLSVALQIVALRWRRENIASKQ